MDEDVFYNQLFNLLDEKGISYEDDRANRQNAIKILLELKRRKAKNFEKKIVEETEIISMYVRYGIDGVKKMFKRNECYLYECDFVYTILFFHYEQKWEHIENLIQWKLMQDYE
tara:strand:- start:3665 stop:4006 length:342 start_codon:yes stop_codon:yes gene_type:complete